MTGERVSFDGTHIRLKDAQLHCRYNGRTPIWIGGSGQRRTLADRRRWADVWHTFGAPESLRPLSAQLDNLAEAAGRDPATILRAASLSLSDPIDEVRRIVHAWRDAGFGYLGCGWPSEVRHQVEKFASRILSEFN